MASLKTIGFINSFIDETRKTQRDFAAIRAKKAERESKDELFKLQKKNIESQIKVRERVNPVEAKSMADELKEFSNLLKTQSDLEHGILDQAQSENVSKQKALSNVARQITPSLTISRDVRGQRSSSLKFSVDEPKKVSTADRFQEGFAQAEAGDITFDELGKQFPGKRKAIKDQRVAALPEKSQRLLGQIETEITEDAKAARKVNEISNPEDVIADFLGEIVENRVAAERAGHDVDNILDILGVTEQEVLDNQSDPDKGFLEKLKDASGLFSPLKAGFAISEKIKSLRGK